MNRDPSVLLDDVAQAAAEIAELMQGPEFEVSSGDIRTQRAG